MLAAIGRARCWLEELVARTLSKSKEAAILEAAKRLFPQYGYEGTSVDLIANEADVSKATVYSHFGDKEALFTRMVEDYCDEQEALIRGIQAQNLTAREEIRHLATIVAGALNVPGALQTNRMVMGEAARFPLLGRMFVEAGVCRLQHVVANMLEGLNRDGRMQIPAPEMAAELLIGMIRSSLQVRSLRALGRPPSKEEIATVVDSAVDLLVTAYGHR